MIDLIIFIIVAVILGTASLYIFKSRKKGVKCIGCPESGHCMHQCNENVVDNAQK